MAAYTPMIQQYLDIKQKNEDAILLFRLGDFYEMFFEDAQTASRELEIVLTSRDGGACKIPMCGVPYHAVNNYIAKLVSRGYKIAVCDQVEDPRTATGIVKREVTRIITAGTILDDMMLDEGKNNYLAALVADENVLGFSYIDISTGDFWVTEVAAEKAGDWLDNEIQRVNPSECLVEKNDTLPGFWKEQFENRGLQISAIDSPLSMDAANKILLRHFELVSLDVFGMRGFTAGLKAAAAIVDYLYQTQKERLQHIQKIMVYHTENYMELDGFTRRNLELTSTLRENKKEGSLLEVLDLCATPVGKRMIRKWLEQPLLDVNAINSRLDAVAELKDHILLREEIIEHLKKVHDLERLAGKIGSGLVNPREFLALKKSLQILPSLKETLKDCSSQLLLELADLDPLTEVAGIIEETLDEEAPLNIKEGGLIRSGFSQEIDELKELSSQGKDWLLDFESREKEKTGMKFLKVSYNKVFGYYIEISKSNLSLVPDHYIRKQTLVNTERYITEELKKYEEKILHAREQLFDLEYQAFLNLRKQIEPFIADILKTAGCVAQIDVLTALSLCAYHNDYIRPVLVNDGQIEIKAGRHPVVEKSLKEGRFVPNDVRLDLDENRFAIITGPNMGGKSTYMRQIAIIQIMAQIGSFVPAEEARLSVVDRIFTRVGASDDLAAGQSTFMVEMVELAHILNRATRNSLVVLDEIGRGTSTYDGLSIAQAVTEYINQVIKAKTLFATHYHELTSLVDDNPGTFNLSVSVMESGESVTFLKKVLPGKADKSYGIHVAKLAGLPQPVIQRAGEILNHLEEEKQTPAPPAVPLLQGNLFEDDQHSELITELQALSPDQITPREALDLIYKWKAMI